VVGAKLCFAYVGTILWALPILRLTAWGASKACLFEYLFVGSAHARQKLSFWTSSWYHFMGSAHFTPNGVGRKQSLLI
jgi:hypothetical protein